MTESHISNSRIKDMYNPSCRYSEVTQIPYDAIYKTIVEAAKVSAAMRDFYIIEALEVPKNVKEYNPSRRDAY